MSKRRSEVVSAGSDMACEPAVEAPQKRPRGRPRKQAAADEPPAKEEQLGEE